MTETISRTQQLKQKRRFWKQHIDGWKKSGLTQAEYCRRLQLKAHQMAYWKKQFFRRQAKTEFVPVPITPLMATKLLPATGKLHIILSNGLKVEVSPGFDPQLLCQVVVALRGLT